MSEISAQSEVIRVLSQTSRSKNLPHLLFYGPAGTGKTTSALALAREIYGEAAYKGRVLELNASDERGISVVREKIKNFARLSVATSNKNLPPYKLIILDEADSMSTDAQSALRRTMELYSSTTRFCLICNYVTRIIEPVSSRCAKFRFKALDVSSAVGRLEFVCKAENLVFDKQQEVLEAVVGVCSGDLRKSITLLQSAARFLGRDASVKEVEEVAGVIPTNRLAEFMNVILSPHNTNPGLIERQIEGLLMDGFSADLLLSQVSEWVIQNEALGTLEKSAICLKVAQVEKSMRDGASPHLQLLDLGYHLNGLVAGK